MNVAFLDSIEVTTYGGMEEWIRLVAEGLAARGHSVTVIGREDSDFLHRMEGGNDSIRLEPMRISGDFDPMTIARLKRVLSDKAIELISVNFNKDVRLGGLAALINGNTRVVWSLGLNITSDSVAHRFLTPRLISGVIVPSQALKDEVVASGYIAPDSVEVIPIGIPSLSMESDRQRDREQLVSEFDLPSDSIIAVTVGRFVEHKGHRYLVKAAPDIIEKYPAIRFLWLGDGPLEEELKQVIEENKLTDRFVFAGMRSDVPDLLSGADIMVHPSILEPFGIAVLEGMRAGLPVVASRVGGIPEVVSEGSTAILSEPLQPSSIEDAVCGLLGDRMTMKAMGEAGRERWSKNFRYEHMIDRVESHFQKLVSRHEV
jgi:glycosyltransferase involved in cell wall biosynthesis